MNLSDNILSAEFVGKTVEDPELGIGIIRNVENGFAEIEFIEAEGCNFMVINLAELEKNDK